MRFTSRVFCLIVAFLSIAASGCSSVDQTLSDASSDDAVSESGPGIQIYQATGVVTAVNNKSGEVSIDHEDIPGFMSAMKMTFPVRDRSLIEGLNPGDKIEFELERRSSDLTVTKIIRKSGSGLAEGASVFRANCAKCHGAAGGGTEKGISFLEGHALDHPREDFIKRVKDGKEGKMPSFADKLSDKQIEAVVSYIRDVIQKDAKKSNAASHEH